MFTLVAYMTRYFANQFKIANVQIQLIQILQRNLNNFPLRSPFATTNIDEIKVQSYNSHLIGIQFIHSLIKDFNLLWIPANNKCQLIVHHHPPAILSGGRVIHPNTDWGASDKVKSLRLWCCRFSCACQDRVLVRARAFIPNLSVRYCIVFTFRCQRVKLSFISFSFCLLWFHFLFVSIWAFFRMFWWFTRKINFRSC